MRSAGRSVFFPGVLVMTGMALLGALPAAAATRYVDRGNGQCSDSGAGTASTPYCTIVQAGKAAVAGDTVVVASGTYADYVKVLNSGTATAPIVIRAADGANVTVSGQYRGFEISSKSWITISGFNVSKTTSYGIYVTGSAHITVAFNHVTTAGQPTNGAEQAGIYVDSSTDSTIGGNVTDHNSDAGIYVTNGSTRITVVGNVSSYNARVYVRAAPGIDVRSGGNTIVGNICHDNEDTGIQIYAYSSGVPAPNNLIVNNLCYNNGDHGIDVSSAGSQRVIGNTVYKNVAAGINVEGPSSGTLLANNVSVDNAINGPRSRSNIRVDSQSTSGTTTDYDLVFLSQTGQVQIIWGSTSYSTLAAFKTATGQEAHGREADPRWVSAGSGDFHLAPGSPAIDSANSGASGALATDIENSPRADDPVTADTGAGPRTYDDRGCYEYRPSGTYCGNGVVEAGEQCDGGALGGASCQSLGYYCSTGSGLACNANCTFNTSSCVSGSCGDASLQSACGESCDGTALGGATCGTVGCTGGSPTCTSSCAVSYATCTGCPVCGNGVKETGEQCDGSALGGATCQSLGYYCSTGSGLTCSSGCTYGTSNCVSGSCGDGIIESACGERCDGTALGGATCRTLGYDSGTLRCASGCIAFNTSNCVKCNNNGVCESGENCNGCPGDCFKSAPVCGNGKCETANGENCLTCPQDCNGTQTGKKDNRYCCGSGGGSNPVSCGDSRCSAGGRTCTATFTPTSCCGDGSCQSNETTTTCGVDCAP